MRLSASLLGFVCLANLVIAAPRTNFRDVVDDINDLHRRATKLENHIHGLDMMSMMEDKKAIIDGLDHITRDAAAVKGFTSSEASQVIDAARGLAQEIDQVSKVVVDNRNNIPGPLHEAVANDLHVITAHAKAAGEAVVNDCPADKKPEAGRVIGEIANALSNAAKAFSS